MLLDFVALGWVGSFAVLGGLVFLIFFIRRDWFYRVFRIRFFYVHLEEADGEVVEYIRKVKDVKPEGFIMINEKAYGVDLDRSRRKNGRMLLTHSVHDYEPRTFSGNVDEDMKKGDTVKPLTMDEGIPKEDWRKGVAEYKGKFDTLVWSPKFVAERLSTKGISDLHRLAALSTLEKLLIVGIGITALAAAAAAYFGYNSMYELEAFMNSPAGGGLP